MGPFGFELRDQFTARAPAAPVALAGIIGILADSLLAPPLQNWWLLLVTAILILLLLNRRPYAAAAALMIGCAAAFGAWHHLSEHAVPPDAERFLSDDPRPVQIEARVIRPSWIQEREHDHAINTLAVFDDVLLIHNTGQPASFPARLRLVMENAELQFFAGERLRVIGKLAKPASAGNPGGFNFRDWLHRQGVAAVLRVDTPEAVERIGFAPSLLDRLHNQRHALRQSAVARLEHSMAPENARVAEALLLGTRQQLPDDLRQAFMESGTLHVLAISGVNVGVIWLGLVRFCRTLGWSLRNTSWATIAGLLLYIWLTDANPPIVRAVSVAIVFQLAELLHRQVSTLQGLSLAMLVVLAISPQDLFHPGAQLSFLSVSALSVAQRWWDTWRAKEYVTLDARPVGPGAKLAEVAQWLWSGFLQANLSTGTVWAMTLPLVAWRFHLISFAGFFLNVLLGPLVCVLLWSGYVWLVCAALSPELSEIPMRLFEAALVGLIWLTQQAASWPAGHMYVAGPPEWWVTGFYVLLAAGGLIARGEERKWIAHGLLTWINVGLMWAWLVPADPAGLVCEVLSVGHGLAVVTHFPNGRVMVYDAGSLSGPEIAAEAVCGSVWRHGQRRIDALVLSHADADHCNAVPLIAARAAPGTLMAHRTFLDFTQDSVKAALESWTAHHGGCRLIAAGDKLLIDPAVEITMLHPAANFAALKDNPNSIVLRIDYAGRRILLTGDLEREGLSTLLALPREPVDVLLSPHHGSKLANPPELAGWSHPDWVAISASDRHVEQRLTTSFDGMLLNTANRGLVRCEIRPNGELKVTTFR